MHGSARASTSSCFASPWSWWCRESLSTCNHAVSGPLAVRAPIRPLNPGLICYLTPQWWPPNPPANFELTSPPPISGLTVFVEAGRLAGDPSSTQSTTSCLALPYCCRPLSRHPATIIIITIYQYQLQAGGHPEKLSLRNSLPLIIVLDKPFINFFLGIE